MLPVEQPFKTFTGLDGRPLDNGYIYVGKPNRDPKTSPVTVYWDAEKKVPAAQPLRTINGYIVRAGAPANVYVDGEHSVLVLDRRHITVLSRTEFRPEEPVQTEVHTVQTEGQRVFELKNIAYTPGVKSLKVYVDGFRLSGDEYVETNRTTVTFRTGQTKGVEVLFETGSGLNSLAATDASMIPFFSTANTPTNVGAFLQNIASNTDISRLNVASPAGDNDQLLIRQEGANKFIRMASLRAEVAAPVATERLAAEAARDQAVAAAQAAQQSSSTVTYLTYAALLTDVAQPANTQGRVTNDGDQTKNGYWIWTGAAWQRSGLQPVSPADLAKVQSRLVGAPDLSTESLGGQHLMTIQDGTRDSLRIMAGDQTYLEIDTQSNVLRTSLRIDDGVEAEPELYFIKSPPTFHRDTTVPAYRRQSRLYQGTPTIERTAGGNYWVAWRADTATGHEGAGNFAVMGRMANPAAPLVEMGVFAFDDLAAFITDPMLWRAPDNCLWMFFGVSGNGTDWDGVGGSWAVICQNPDAQFPVWGKPFRLSYHSDPRRPVMINGQWYIAIDGWRFSAALPPRYLERSGGVIHRIDWQNQRVHKVSKLPPNNNGTYSGFFETEFFQRADGSVLATCRWTAGAAGVLYSISNDMMQTWTSWENYTALAPASSSRIWLGRSPSGRVACCWNNDEIRRTLTLGLSDDDGVTFPYRVLIEPNQEFGVSYPIVTFGDDGQIIVVYDVERNIFRQIRVATVIEDQVVAGTAVPFINVVSTP